MDAVKAAEEICNGTMFMKGNNSISEKGFFKLGFNSGWNAHQSQLEEENKRLRLLIKEGFIALNKEWGKTLGQIDKDWETFKEQNNL